MHFYTGAFVSHTRVKKSQFLCGIYDLLVFCSSMIVIKFLILLTGGSITLMLSWSKDDAPEVSSAYGIFPSSFSTSLLHPAHSDGTAPDGTAMVPHALQLQWETQGVSGRAYQNDGNLALYRKKVRSKSKARRKW